MLEAWAQNKARAERITKGAVVKKTTDTVTEIAWSSDGPGSSIVKYGTSPNALNQTAEKPWGGTKESNGDYSHTVWITNLKPNTTYYFHSGDRAGPWNRYRDAKSSPGASYRGTQVTFAVDVPSSGKERTFAVRLPQQEIREPSIRRCGRRCRRSHSNPGLNRARRRGWFVLVL